MYIFYDILKYKNLYSYLKSQATKLYYQLCENHMMNFQRGFELHPETMIKDALNFKV